MTTAKQLASRSAWDKGCRGDVVAFCNDEDIDADMIVTDGVRYALWDEAGDGVVSSRFSTLRRALREWERRYPTRDLTVSGCYLKSL